MATKKSGTRPAGATKAHPKGSSAGPGARPTAPVRRPAPHIRQNVPTDQVANKVAVATADGLTLLGRLPKGVLPGVVAVLVLVGLVTGGIVGLVCLLAVVGLLGWLLAAFWPMIPTAGRVVRVAALAGVLVIGILQAL